MTAGRCYFIMTEETIKKVLTETRKQVLSAEYHYEIAAKQLLEQHEAEMGDALQKLADELKKNAEICCKLNAEDELAVTTYDIDVIAAKHIEKIKNKRAVNSINTDKTNMENSKLKWDGNADLANKVFGDGYGTDWEYTSRESQDIIVNGKTIKVGDEI